MLVSFSCHLVRELMDGLRIYFNFTLPTLLLYNFEREQFRNTMQISSTEMNSNNYVNKTEQVATEEKCSVVSSTTENASGNTQSSLKEKESKHELKVDRVMTRMANSYSY